MLSLSLFLVPIAIWLAVRWALLVPAVELEEHPDAGRAAPERELVRLQWLKVGTLVVVAAAIAIVLGPLLGAVLILLVDAPVRARQRASPGSSTPSPCPSSASRRRTSTTTRSSASALGEAEPAPAELPAEI